MKKKFASSAVCLALVLGVGSCKTTRNQSKLVDNQSSSSKDISEGVKKAVDEIALKPVTSIARTLNVLKTQLIPMQVQALKQQPQLATLVSEMEAGYEKVRQTYRQAKPIWRLIEAWSGPDGKLNYGDTVKTLQCTPDSEVKSVIASFLQPELDAARGYKKTALVKLNRMIAGNERFPQYRDAINLDDLFSAEGRQRIVNNEINRRMANMFISQCQTTKAELTGMGLFDVVKRRCYQAMEWKVQGILLGVFQLRYDDLSQDTVGEGCEGRGLSERLVGEALAILAEFKGDEGGKTPPLMQTATCTKC